MADIRRRVDRRTKDTLKRALVRLNRRLERLGFRLQLVHYYSETPARRQLASTKGTWARDLSMRGVEWDLDEQLSWLGSHVSPYVGEVAGLDAYRRIQSGGFGPGFGPIESQALHCIVRSLAPGRLTEVGSGVSTMVSLAASQQNRLEGRGDTAITCVEPFPHQALRRAEGITLVPELAQSAPSEIFEELESGDVLFLDSTHAVKTGSELTRLYLEILPALRPGVVVHIHDICLPYAYCPDILHSLFDWQESALVAALITDNPRLKVLACMSALHHGRAAELCQMFPDYRPCAMESGLSEPDAPGHFPSSLWLTVVDRPR